jgi:6-phosphogluconolactonase
MHQFDSRQQLDFQLADRIAKVLADDLSASGSAILVVSGGRTPRGLFAALSQIDIDWARVTITLADERWVDDQHADSNHKLVRENLCVERAAAAQFVPLKNAAESARQGEAECAAALAALGRFSLVLLGMGDDGHTASLFPGAPELSRGLDLRSGIDCLAIQPTAAPHERMSLSLPRLLNTRQIVLHLAGADKLQVLERVCAGSDAAEYPVRGVLQQQAVAVDIYYAD